MLSPMMKQYLALKEQYKDCLLFFRLGDFYEMFFDDAVTASKALDLTLTGRDCGLKERAPMCGVPYMAVDTYISRLISQGYKVALCEQTSEPSAAAKLVDRDVVRIYTSGTLTDTEMLDEDKNNYIAGVFYVEEGYGLCWCDLSTGELFVSQFSAKNSEGLNDALAMIKPSEIICNEEMLALSYDLPVIKNGYCVNFSIFEGAAFDYIESHKAVENVLSRKNLEQRLAVCAAGALLKYIGKTQRRPITHINERIHEARFMQLDYTARRNLELTECGFERKKRGSLLWLLSRTCTKPGARMLRRYIEQPLYDAVQINRRLDAVEELFKSAVIRNELREALKNMYDIERLTSKIALNTIMPRDLLAVSSSLRVMPSVKKTLNKLASDYFININTSFDLNEDVLDLIDASVHPDSPALLKDGGYIKDGYSSELDGYRNATSEGRNWIEALERTEREATGIKNLKIAHNRVFGYYIEVNKAQQELVPYRYIRKQTIAGGERYITEELKALEDKITHSTEHAIKLEASLYIRIKEELIKHVSKLQQLSANIAEIDFILSLAFVAKENNYVKPDISDNYDCIRIKDGRHPIIELLNKSETYIPNDTKLDGNTERAMVITGPNMAGKSTYMRQVALIVLLAHIGSFVPAKAAKIALTDKIFTRIGASDDLIAGNSTFMVEMIEVSNIIRNATANSLLIMDEIGRGTSTFDGLSIAWAVLDYLVNEIKPRLLFATHYHELTELEDHLTGVKNYKVMLKEVNNEIVFLRKLARGGANQSFGIEVAAMAGVPRPVVLKAKEILKIIESTDISRSQIVLNDGEQQLSIFNAKNENSASEKIIKTLKQLDADELTMRSAMETLLALRDIAVQADE